MQWVFTISATNLGLLNVASALVGTIVGHKWALGRDKRAEFNALTQDAMVALVKQIEAGKAGRPRHRVTMEWELLHVYLSRRQWQRFSSDLEAYNAAGQDVSSHNFEDGTATVDLAKLEHQIACAAQLLRYLRPR